MAKSIILGKEFNKRRQYVKHFLNRQVHKSFLKNTKLSISERQVVYNKFNKFSYKYSIVRLKNRCILTGRSRGVLNLFNISRIKVREMLDNGLLPGVKKSSW